MFEKIIIEFWRFPGVTFKAHRLILAACSKHFQELFEGMPPSPAGLIVILDGTSAHNMAALLEFMYRGEVHVSQESLSSFLKAAECLQVSRTLLSAQLVITSARAVKRQLIPHSAKNGCKRAHAKGQHNTVRRNEHFASERKENKLEANGKRMWRKKGERSRDSG